MPGRSDPLASRLGSLTARELLTARAKAARAMGEHKRGQLATHLVQQIDEELERRRAAKLGSAPVPNAHERWQRTLDAAGLSEEVAGLNSSSNDQPPYDDDERDTDFR